MHIPLLNLIFWPFILIMIGWYDLFGLLSEYALNTNYGLYAENWLDFPQIVLTSLSGSGYLVATQGPSDLWSVLVLISAILLISIPLDTLLTNLTIKKIRSKQSSNQSQKTEQQKIKSEKWFVRIYSFWRLLLPDILIAGPLLSWIFQIQTPPKKILKLNVMLQLIRAFLFIGFAILYTL